MREFRDVTYPLVRQAGLRDSELTVACAGVMAPPSTCDPRAPDVPDDIGANARR